MQLSWTQHHCSLRHRLCVLVPSQKESLSVWTAVGSQCSVCQQSVNISRQDYSKMVPRSVTWPGPEAYTHKGACACQSNCLLVGMPVTQSTYRHCSMPNEPRQLVQLVTWQNGALRASHCELQARCQSSHRVTLKGTSMAFSRSTSCLKRLLMVQSRAGMHMHESILPIPLCILDTRGYQTDLTSLTDAYHSGSGRFGESRMSFLAQLRLKSTGSCQASSSEDGTTPFQRALQHPSAEFGPDPSANNIPEANMEEPEGHEEDEEDASAQQLRGRLLKAALGHVVGSSLWWIIIELRSSQKPRHEVQEQCLSGCERAHASPSLCSDCIQSMLAECKGLECGRSTEWGRGPSVVQICFWYDIQWSCRSC